MRLKWWQRIALNALVFLALAGLIPGFYVGSIWTALGASIVLGILNVMVKPFLILLSLPITLLTFGLFSIVVNALILSLTSVFVGANFAFASFGTTLIVAIAMSIVSSVINTQLTDR